MTFGLLLCLVGRSTRLRIRVARANHRYFESYRRLTICVEAKGKEKNGLSIVDRQGFDSRVIRKPALRRSDPDLSLSNKGDPFAVIPLERGDLDDDGYIGTDELEWNRCPGHRIFGAFCFPGLPLIDPGTGTSPCSRRGSGSCSGRRPGRRSRNGSGRRPGRRPRRWSRRGPGRRLGRGSGRGSRSKASRRPTGVGNYGRYDRGDTYD